MKIALASLIVILASLPALAQVNATDAGIDGYVQDDSGACVGPGEGTPQMSHCL